MKILILAGLFPPDVIGGAEISASGNLKFLQGQGHEVAVLTTAKAKHEALAGAEINGVKTWRIWMPRPYPLFYFSRAKWWLKPLWHLQDHFDPRNRRILAKVLEEFKPDFVYVHILQGLGYNMLTELSRRNLPTTYVLHDLGLACIKMSMFKNGRECVGQCLECQCSSAYKQRLLGKFKRLGFLSPSRFNLNEAKKYVGVIAKYPHAAILNLNRYAKPTVTKPNRTALNFLFVGRLHSTKGIGFLLEVFTALAKRYKFTVTVAGGGPEEAELHQAYANAPWCTFTGFVNQQAVMDLMGQADMLCIPSIWAENSPGVVIQALGVGLPVIGSDKAGIPELVEHERNGLLALPGDHQDWESALERVIKNPAQLKQWGAYAKENSGRFDLAQIGKAMDEFRQQVIES